MSLPQRERAEGGNVLESLPAGGWKGPESPARGHRSGAQGWLCSALVLTPPPGASSPFWGEFGFCCVWGQGCADSPHPSLGDAGSLQFMVESPFCPFPSPWISAAFPEPSPEPAQPGAQLLLRICWREQPQPLPGIISDLFHPHCSPSGTPCSSHCLNCPKRGKFPFCGGCSPLVPGLEHPGTVGGSLPRLGWH